MGGGGVWVCGGAEGGGGGGVTARSPGLLKPGGKLVSTAMIRQSFQKGSGRLAVVFGMLRLSLWSLTHPGKKAYFWDVTNAVGKDLFFLQDFACKKSPFGGITNFE